MFDTVSHLQLPHRPAKIALSMPHPTTILFIASGGAYDAQKYMFME
jgi:hypothetical protein